MGGVRRRDRPARPGSQPRRLLGALRGLWRTPATRGLKSGAGSAVAWLLQRAARPRLWARQRRWLHQTAQAGHSALLGGVRPTWKLARAAHLRGIAHHAPRAALEHTQVLTRPVLAQLGGYSRPALVEPQLAEMLQRFRQPQVRYRPGFSRYWRQHRRTFVQQF